MEAHLQNAIGGLWWKAMDSQYSCPDCKHGVRVAECDKVRPTDPPAYDCNAERPTQCPAVCEAVRAMAKELEA